MTARHCNSKWLIQCEQAATEVFTGFIFNDARCSLCNKFSFFKSSQRFK